ncbi:MAG TPA: hypothetical protein VFT12_02465 [Thermoanaerobaculia bacterium]|nr:hypothetical protein [Thermoanaerobaculia bacterium]
MSLGKGDATSLVDETVIVATQRHRTQLARRLVWFFLGAVVLMAVGLFVVALV